MQLKKTVNFKIMSCCNIFVIKTKSAVFVCLIVIVRLCGAAQDSNPRLPASRDELERLADDVCDELNNFEQNEKTKHCRRKFLKSYSSISSEPSPVHLLCQSRSELSYSVPLLDEQQLVVLIQKGEGYIEYNILGANTSEGDISTVFPSPNGYEVWSTVLYDGYPSDWLKGPDIPIWDLVNQSYYNITVEEPYFDYINGSVFAHFNWRVNNSNICSKIVITNRCSKKHLGDFSEKTVKLGVNTSLVIDGLPLDDECIFKMGGDNRSFVKKYRTPTCDEFQQCVPKPDIPKDVYISSSEGAFGWDVRVKWAQPRHPPEMYNVTLRADAVHNAILHGNATEVTFENVTGHGIYNVSIAAIAANGNAYSGRRAIFRARAESSVAVVMIGAWCVILAIGGIVAGAAVYLRRRRHDRMRKIYFPDKLSKDFDSEIGLETSVEDSWEVRADKLLLHEVIGEGAFGVVRRGTLAPGKEVAVKMLKDFPTLDEIRSFRAEMELMKSVGAHPHIVSLVGCCSGRRPLIVAEYCSRGDLLSYLRSSFDIMVSKRNAKYYNNNFEDDYRNDLFKSKREHAKLVVNKLYDLQDTCDPDLTCLDLLSFCRQIAMGMEFLSNNRVVHRDLAARNILVSGNRMLKIADFGLSRDVYQENQYKQKGNGKMPIKWMALESLTHRIYTSQSDVWSFGVVIWEVMTLGAAPYPDVPVTRLLWRLKSGYRMPKPNNCSKQLYELMLSCWRARPRDRPTFADLHRSLDALLDFACADEYLSLELDAADAPQTPAAHRYVKMLLSFWPKGESYERPLKSNHYTSPPAIPKVQVV